MSYKLRFGRHRNKPLYSVPDDYLVWLNSVAQGELKQHCVDEIVKRFSAMIKDEIRFDEPDYNGDYEWWKD